MKLTAYHPFKSEKAKQRYYNFYNELSKSYPVDHETKYIETTWGSTFIRISGKQDGKPLIMLPSANGTSLIWNSNVKELGDHFKVYNIDTITDFGRSIYRKDFKTGKDLADWLAELFDVLGLVKDVNIMGLSHGGWITSQFALHYPKRLNKIIMCAPPATIIQLPAKWAWQGLSMLLPHPYFMRKMTEWMFPILTKQHDETSQKLVNDLIKHGFLGLRCFKFKMPVTPTVLTDEELKSIQVPTLFMVGEHEVIYPATDAIARLNAVAPQIISKIIPDAGHDLTIVQSDLVNKLVIDFLEN